MDQPTESSAIDPATAQDGRKGMVAGETILFLHAGGIPSEALSKQLTALKCFGKPKAYFDLDGLMWSEMIGTDKRGFADYLASLIDWTSHDGGRLSALIDYRDLLWLEQRPVFREQLRQRLRVVRLAFLDPALQAFRRIQALRTLDPVKDDRHDPPGFAELARELVEIEEAEQLGDGFCKRYGLPMVKLWIEDLARSRVPVLSGLLDRWSIHLPEGGHLMPIEPPLRTELEAVAAFRAEADRRHWSHALLPDR